MCRVTFSRATCTAVQRSFRKDVLTNQRPLLTLQAVSAAVVTQCCCDNTVPAACGSRDPAGGPEGPFGLGARYSELGSGERNCMGILQRSPYCLLCC